MQITADTITQTEFDEAAAILVADGRPGDFEALKCLVRRGREAGLDTSPPHLR